MQAALQAGGDLGIAGVDARVFELGEFVAIALVGGDGTQDLLAGLADLVGNDVGELNAGVPYWACAKGTVEVGGTSGSVRVPL